MIFAGSKLYTTATTYHVLNSVSGNHYDYSRMNVAIVDYANKALSYNIYTEDEAGHFGVGTCGALIDVNQSSTSSTESVIAGCGYTDFNGSDDREPNSNYRLGLLKVDSNSGSGQLI